MKIHCLDKHNFVRILVGLKILKGGCGKNLSDRADDEERLRWLSLVFTTSR